MAAPNMNGRLYLADAHQNSPASFGIFVVRPFLHFPSSVPFSSCLKKGARPALGNYQRHETTLKRI
jgi:hypothetical protein